MLSIAPKLPIIKGTMIIVESETVKMTLRACPLVRGTLPSIGVSSGCREEGFSLYLTIE